MPTKTILSRVGNVDFFAVFPAGFYIFLVIACSFLAKVEKTGTTSPAASVEADTTSPATSGKADTVSPATPGMADTTSSAASGKADTISSAIPVKVGTVSPAAPRKADTTLSLWTLLQPLIDGIKTNPVSLLFILFASYLLGSILRTMRVGWAETWSRPFEGVIVFVSHLPHFGDGTKAFRNLWKLRTGFPYREILVDALRNLYQNNAAITHNLDKFPSIRRVRPEAFLDVYNHWKELLCMQEPEAFDNYQTFEARSRFFTGMFWAGLAGILGSIYLFFQASSCPPAMELLIISLILTFSFGGQLHRGREQEAKVLLSSYISYLQGPKGSQTGS